MNWNHLYKHSRVFDKGLLLEATVVHGFKRGSKELGVPTANLSMDELGPKGEEMATGIYYGLSKLCGPKYVDTPLYPTVLSVGWNPFYKNERKAVEAHLMVEGDMADFYDDRLSVLVLGYLRDEANFSGLDELISCINEDIARSKAVLSDGSTDAMVSPEWSKER